MIFLFLKILFLLKSLGPNTNEILFIYSSKFTILSFIGVFIGFLLVVIFQYFQNSFHIITIPEHIYYMRYLPIKINFVNAAIVAHERGLDFSHSISSESASFSNLISVITAPLCLSF